MFLENFKKERKEKRDNGGVRESSRHGKIRGKKDAIPGHRNAPVALVVALARPEDVVDHDLALVLGAVELYARKRRAPALDLVHPVGHGGLGHEHEVRPLVLLKLVHVPQDGYGLQRFSEAHLVGQDAVDAVLVVADEPVEALELVGAHLALDARRLLRQARALNAVAALEVLPVALRLRHAPARSVLLLPRGRVLHLAGVDAEVGENVALLQEEGELLLRLRRPLRAHRLDLGRDVRLALGRRRRVRRNIRRGGACRLENVVVLLHSRSFKSAPKCDPRGTAVPLIMPPRKSASETAAAP